MNIYSTIHVYTEYIPCVYRCFCYTFVSIYLIVAFLMKLHKVHIRTDITTYRMFKLIRLYATESCVLSDRPNKQIRCIEHTVANIDKAHLSMTYLASFFIRHQTSQIRLKSILLHLYLLMFGNKIPP